jgi:hypothetical protein
VVGGADEPGAKTAKTGGHMIKRRKKRIRIEHTVIVDVPEDKLLDIVQRFLERGLDVRHAGHPPQQNADQASISSRRLSIGSPGE